MLAMVSFSLICQSVTNEISSKSGVIDPNPNELFKTLQIDSSSNEILYVNNIGDSILDYSASIDYNGFVSDSIIHENKFDSVLGWISSGTPVWLRETTWDGGSLDSTGFAKISSAYAGGGTSTGYLNSNPATFNLAGYASVNISWIQKTVMDNGIDTAFLQVSNDGIDWITVYSTTSSTGTWTNGASQSVLVPSEYYTSEARIRYGATLTAKQAHYFAIDDIVITVYNGYNWLTLDGGTTTSGLVAVSISDPIIVGFNSVGLAEGTYTANIRLTSDYSNVSVPVQLNVVDVILPEVPALISPANGLNLNDLTPYFNWSDVADATAYNILVDNNSDYSSPEVNTEVSASNYQTATSLPEGTYYWKVRSKNEAGYSEFTSSWSVNIIFVWTPPIPVPIILPPNTIDWQDIDGATSYNIYSSPNPYGTFTFLANVTESYYTFSSADPRMFFFITGVNSSKEQPKTIEIPKKVK